MKQGKRDDGFRMSDVLWQQIEPLLPAPKPHPLGCHRPRVPNRAAMDAILLVLRTGMQWNALDDTGVCTCSSAYRRFREWVDAGVFATFWRLGLLEYDELKGIDWSWLALDGTMTKAPLGGKKTGPNPCDRGKGGVKRSLLTEAHGVPLALEVAAANRHDMKLVSATLAHMMCAQPDGRRRSNLCLDMGYDYEEVRQIVDIAGFEPVILGRREEQENKKQHGARARRWVVERTHSWLNRFRRLLVRWEKREDTYLAMLQLACGIIAWR
ncbi:IS5 family transposase [Noviherbaspirillum aerium]|uniref:IS5 family transposase n=1 Tax=Noviherbaspirillum aerium TaxID=2588497 RepID=UPI00178C67FC|nr:IS5 family transposase [Noviherbaspirillum aerium]